MLNESELKELIYQLFIYDVFVKAHTAKSDVLLEISARTMIR